MTGLEIVAAGFTATKAASDAIKIISDLTKHPNVDGRAVEGLLIQLQGHIVSANQSLAGAQTEIYRLTAEAQEFKRSADFGRDFKFEDGVYWHRDYPYCPNCWDAEQKPTRLDGPFNSTSEAERSWRWVVHKSNYYLRARGHR